SEQPGESLQRFVSFDPASIGHIRHNALGLAPSSVHCLSGKSNFVICYIGADKPVTRQVPLPREPDCDFGHVTARYECCVLLRMSRICKLSVASDDCKG